MLCGYEATRPLSAGLVLVPCGGGLRKLKLNFKLYLQGELVENPVDHPMIRPSMNSVKATYELAQDPQYETLTTVASRR